MNLDEIKALGPRPAELCRKYGIAELAVFGSVARGDPGPDSGVDPLLADLIDNARAARGYLDGVTGPPR